MMTISFLLKEPSKDSSLIYMFVFTGQKKPLKYSIGEIVPVKYWVKKSQRAKECYEFPRAKIINQYVKSLTRFVESTYIPGMSNEQLREQLDIFRGKATVEKDYCFKTCFKKFIDNDPERSNIKSYITTYNAVCELMPDGVDIADIDYSYLDKFQKSFSIRAIKRLSGDSKFPTINYTSLQIKNIKAVLHYYEKTGIRISPTIDSFKKAEEAADNIYLSTEEIEKLRTMDLPNNKLSNARDIFLIGCYTAMRISDYKVINKDNVQNELIYKTTKKTGDRVIIPLHKNAKQILEKHSYKLPKISDQRLNDYIKEVCKLAGINSTVVVTKTEGGKKVSRKYEKWELVTTHTARRSGATNMYLAGIPSISIMMVTGHKTEKAFMKYIKVTKEQNAQLLANHEFFK